MMLSRSYFSFALISGLFIFLSSCQLREDPGPLQYAEEPFFVTDFDRLEIGDAMFVTVRQGSLFSISARGDSRNLNDLVVSRVGNTLVIRFDQNRSRKHTTKIEISMPELKSAIFSGATATTVSGFTSEDAFYMNVSGASTAQLDISVSELEVSISGASNLTLAGGASILEADLSGASLLKAYNIDAENVTIDASGASHAYVKASKFLNAAATGASSILYRGDAVVNSSTNGASTIIKDE